MTTLKHKPDLFTFFLPKTANLGNSLLAQMDLPLSLHSRRILFSLWISLLCMVPRDRPLSHQPVPSSPTLEDCRLSNCTGFHLPKYTKDTSSQLSGATFRHISLSTSLHSRVCPISASKMPFSCLLKRQKAEAGELLRAQDQPELHTFQDQPELHRLSQKPKELS